MTGSGLHIERRGWIRTTSGSAFDGVVAPANYCANASIGIALISCDTFCKSVGHTSGSSQTQDGVSCPDGSTQNGVYYCSCTGGTDIIDHVEITTGDIVDVNAAACSPITYKTVDAGGSNVNTSTNVTIALRRDSPTGKFYSDSACSTAAITSIVLPSGTSTQTVYYKDFAITDVPYRVQVDLLGVEPATIMASVIQTVFVTSTTYDGAFGGFGQADLICKNRALAAGMESTAAGSFHWRGVVSSSVLNAPDHFVVYGKVLNTVGDKIADDSTDFWDGTIDNPVKYDEFGAAAIGARVWSGADANGVATANTCNDWQTNATGFADIGKQTLTTGWFTGDQKTCDSLSHLYCISVK